MPWDSIDKRRDEDSSERRRRSRRRFKLGGRRSTDNPKGRSTLNEQVVSKALELLPAYGGFVEGAVNQALLLLHVPFDKEMYKAYVEEVQSRICF